MSNLDELVGKVHEDLGDVFSLSNVLSFMSSGALMLGGVIPYVPQYLEIKRTESTDGFSMYVCLALLIANTLRILFWFGHPFEYPLLAQSVIMNLSMLALISLCITVRNRTQIIPTHPRVFTEQLLKKEIDTKPTSPLPATIRLFTDFDVKYFWEWTDFLSYVEFLMSFTCAAGALVYLFLAVPAVIETIGSLAVAIEAMLGIPQYYTNYVHKSTKGMSVKMVAMWTIGDVYKTTYFIVKKTPLQFLICGLLQIFIDLNILGQVLIYGRTQPGKPYKHNS